MPPRNNIQAFKELGTFLGNKFDTLITRIEELLRRPQEIKIDLKETNESLNKGIETQTKELVKADRTNEVVTAITSLQSTLQKKEMQVIVPELSLSPLEAELKLVQKAIQALCGFRFRRSQNAPRGCQRGGTNRVRCRFEAPRAIPR